MILFSLKKQKESSIISINKKLTKIKNRYFRPVIKYPDGFLNHLFDCKIYSADDHYTPHCNCGLLHDLNWISIDLSEKIYSKDLWEEDMNRMYGQNNSISDEQFNEIMSGLSFKFVEISDEEQLKTDKEHWAAIEEVFGNSFKDMRFKEYYA